MTPTTLTSAELEERAQHILRRPRGSALSADDRGILREYQARTDRVLKADRDRSAKPDPARTATASIVADVRRQVEREATQPIRLTEAEQGRFARVRALADADTAGRMQITEAHIYSPKAGGHSFLRDLINYAKNRDVNATARLERNNAEVRELERRAGIIRAAAPNQSSTSGGEFDPPAWAIAQAAPMLRAGRPFLNALGTKPLLPKPGSSSLNFPKLATGSTVAVQTDGSTVSQQDWTTSGVTAQIQTAAGRAIASFQFLDLSPEADQQALADLLFGLNSALDSAALNSTVANAKGLLNISSPNTVTYTDASPTGAEFYQPVMQGAAAIGKNAFVDPDFCLTHPSIWANIAAGLDASNRPLIVPSGSTVGKDVASRATSGSPMISADSGGASGFIGSLAGIPVVVDANIPTNLGGGTNEARMVVLSRAGFDFWETPPRFTISTDSALMTNLQAQIVAVSYFACTSRQSKAVSILSGSGLIPVSGL
jgi:hypothetical protein